MLNSKQREDLWAYLYDGGDTPTFLYEDYGDQMPYGTVKARTGDPDNWLADRIEDIEDRYRDDLEIERVLRSTKGGLSD